jgi:hypothetical protein
VDALIYCDMTVSPEGEPVTVEQRIAEVLDRYDRMSVVSRFMCRAGADLQAATRRVEARLAGAARDGGVVSAGSHPM